MKKILNQINETGTMLVEAMAMLGLIAMVTPILYKKAAERTTELQDINASNQLRVLSTAMDSYIKDNFTRINSGEVVKNSCNVSSVDYKDFKDNTTVTFDLSHLCEYLPYGFLKDGKTQDTKLFTKTTPSFQIVLRRTTGREIAEDGKEVIVAQTVTGFLTAVPNEGADFPSTRTSRIATMIGSNGGYVEADGKVLGAQGIWSLKDTSEIGLTLPKNTFVISSLQPISSQGLANEDVLHRKTERQNDYVLNAMETDLFMSYNNKNHNIRQVNQIIMSPQPEWMLGGDENSFDRAVDDTPKSELSEYKADLDHTLYIGSKGGAYIEGNMAAIDSLFTVRSEGTGGGDDGGIKYYASKSETDTTDPSSPVTKNSRGDAVLSVTAGKMEYGNINNTTAGALLTVDKENGSMVFESKSDSTPPGGAPATSSQKLVDANASRVNVIDGALSVRNPGIAADGGRYDDYDTNQWPEQNAAPAVVVGGGDAHKGSYTTYTYADGRPAIVDDDFQSSDYIGEHGLTVNGPAFVKDSLKTAKLKAYNVDAAKLRAGVKPADFDDVTDDRDFYLIAEKKGDQNGRMLVGFNEDAAAGISGYRMQVAEKDEVQADGTNIEAGVKLNHESGVTVRAGDVAGVTNVGLITHDIASNSSSINNMTTAGQVKIGAYDAISLATTDTAGNLIDNSVVSIQDDMLRAYTDAGLVSTARMERYLDSVTDHARFISQGYANTGLQEDDLYSRKKGSGYLFGIGDMDFSVNEVAVGNIVRPVVDIQALRDNNYVTSRFSGGFAVYDHDNVQDETDYPSDALNNIGNASFYVSKGDFQVRATKENTDEDIEKNEIILQVDNNSDTDVIVDDHTRGSVYIRKGAINLATNPAAARLTNAEIKETYDLTTDSDTVPVGYISADRFIAHTIPEGASLNSSVTTINSGDPIVATKGGAVAVYDKFEVNPAYTSVMNDIKLTTRGGARLSDILPDFVNKGIYVVDNTYRDNVIWTAGTKPEKSGDLSGTNPSAETNVSAWLGFVPSPTCPPGYSKVITINPSGWAMAQSGTPVSRSNKIDISTHNNPYLYWYTEDGALRSTVDNAEPVQPLTFQKNNWLKAMVIPDCGGLKYDGKCDNVPAFTGWGTAMGFIYPENYYKDFITNARGHGGGSADKGNIQNTVYWNLYPVHYKELEAYVTVYCYFRRADFDGKYVDKNYDQLNGVVRPFWDKSGASNINNLNDPALKYSDPW